MEIVNEQDKFNFVAQSLPICKSVIDKFGLSQDVFLALSTFLNSINISEKEIELYIHIESKCFESMDKKKQREISEYIIENSDRILDEFQEKIASDLARTSMELMK